MKMNIFLLCPGNPPAPLDPAGVQSRGFTVHPVVDPASLLSGSSVPAAFHAILLDLDGVPEVAKLFALLNDRAGQSLPLVCVASRPSGEILEACFEAGVWCCVDKESGPDLLAANLRMAIKSCPPANLVEQNHIFQSLLKVLPLGVFMVEAPSGRPLVANEAALRLLGRGILPDASRENLAEVYKAFVTGTDQAYLPERMPIVRGMYGESSHVDDLQVERPDGSRRLLEIFGTPVSDETGRIWASLVTFMDITDRKTTEMALQASESRYGRVIAAVNDGIWEWNVTTGKAYFSPSYYRILGYADQEFPADYDHWKTLVHPEDLSRIEAVLSDSTSSGIEFSIEYRMQKKGGDWLWVCSRGKSVESCPGDDIKLMAGNFTDISRRKEAEAEGRLNLDRMHALVDILQRRSASVQEFLDHALEQTLRLSGSKLGYIYHYDEDTREFVLNTWSREVMAECQVANPENRYDLTKTGFLGEVVRQRKPLILNNFQAPHPQKKGYPAGNVELRNFLSVPIFSNDRIVGVVGLANKAGDYDDTDVLQATLLMEAVWKTTEHMQAEQRIKELLAEKDLILKEVHHRIRNNLNTISSLLELQAGDMTDEMAAAALNNSSLRVRSMLHLYSRLYEVQAFQSMEVSLFLPGLVEQIVANFPPLPGLMVSVDVDQFELKVHKLQPIGILVNELITNCMKYAYGGRTSGELRVSLKREENTAVLKVVDDGPGIPENPPTSPAGGFGMTLVDLMTRQIGGTLEISHEKGGGVTVSFPLGSRLPR